MIVEPDELDQLAEYWDEQMKHLPPAPVAKARPVISPGSRGGRFVITSTGHVEYRDPTMAQIIAARHPAHEVAASYRRMSAEAARYAKRPNIGDEDRRVARTAIDDFRGIADQYAAARRAPESRTGHARRARKGKRRGRFMNALRRMLGRSSGVHKARLLIVGQDGRIAVLKAQQFSLFGGPPKEVKEPGKHGGRFYRSEKGAVRYGEKPTPAAPSDLDTSTHRYFHGDKAKYTGAEKDIHGGHFFEFEYVEGHKKGEKGWSQRGPDKPSPSSITTTVHRNDADEITDVKQGEPPKAGEWQPKTAEGKAWRDHIMNRARYHFGERGKKAWIHGQPGKAMVKFRFDSGHPMQKPDADTFHASDLGVYNENPEPADLTPKPAEDDEARRMANIRRYHEQSKNEPDDLPPEKPTHSDYQRLAQHRREEKQPPPRIRTKSGRMIPPPKITGSAANNVKRIDAWLLEHAQAEAKATKNEYVEILFRNLNPKRLSPSDKADLNEFLFGDPEGIKL